MRRHLSTRSLAERNTMATADAPRPAPRGNNKDLLQGISDAQRSVAVQGKEVKADTLAKKLDKAAEPMKPTDTQLTRGERPTAGSGSQAASTKTAPSATSATAASDKLGKH
jgi:hypothetical protein